MHMACYHFAMQTTIIMAMEKQTVYRIVLILSTLSLSTIGCATKESWVLDQQGQWRDALAMSENLNIENGQLHPQDKAAAFRTKLKAFPAKCRLQSVTIRQTPDWDTWKAIDKITPAEADDAPVFIPVAPGDYWFLARWHDDWANGYHAWHSTDMKSWTHYGPVTSAINRWVTSAEYVDGAFYIYFDKPNDEDPHLIIDRDLTDGKQGEEIGMVFADPSHGSDMAIFRDEDGTFHLIYEDWSPLNPGEHSWDSPLAGHADSPDGIHGFEPHEYPPPIDERTRPTGKMVAYEPSPTHFLPGKDFGPYEYELHEGPQDAFGDYTMIKVGDQYYLFCDYDPHHKDKTMRVGRWRSGDITRPFTWDGEIGAGFHPDPTVGFAEGKFYLLVQRSEHDFISSGPWVDGVQIRVGVDTDGDRRVDYWTAWQRVKEHYAQKPGFVRVVDVEPAQFDVMGVPAGYGFEMELRTEEVDGVQPIIDAIEATFAVVE